MSLISNENFIVLRVWTFSLRSYGGTSESEGIPVGAKSQNFALDCNVHRPLWQASVKVALQRRTWEWKGSKRGLKHDA